MNKGFIRVAAAIPTINVADCTSNTKSIIGICNELDKEGVQLAVFPEMSITGYTCADLFHNSTLLAAANESLAKLADATKDLDMAIIVGAPVEHSNTLYNCAIAIAKGRIIAAVPKTYLPNYNEFYEKRWWASGADIDELVDIANEQDVVLCKNQLIEVGGVKVGIEICEDLWTPIPPSSHSALAGAQIIVNLSASDDLIGKYDYLKQLIAQQSARCVCGYVYASAGYGESSTDLVFDGKALIYENGTNLAANSRWNSTEQYSIADIDIDAINRDRKHLGSFHDCANEENKGTKFYTNPSFITLAETTELRRIVNPRPFVPSDDNALNERSEEIINIQVAGLAKRLDFTRCKSLVVGISGGLDSTLALLVATKAYDRLGLDRKGIIGVTMPGFGTTGRTYNNAIEMMKSLGVTIKEISIVDAVNQHFKDIEHDSSIHDVTYENCQARERTQLLMDIANKMGGMVLGTGDLSELALGWATYNGDHMSMYGVNAGVPKTLVKYLVRWFALNADSKTAAILYDIIDTPISPELIPADENGNIKQKTEDLVGPYELHDFFLYYTLRYGFSPKRIYFLAQNAFKGSYDTDTIKKWIRIFFRRFFAQQFKRSCLPDGPKVGSVCLSPRGDWRMPSDASSALWLKECDEL
jgi:NAD+ synthase (glutamine-hydrolysing)